MQPPAAAPVVPAVTPGRTAPAAEVAPADPATGRYGPGLLWMCIHFPDLALEVFRRTGASAGESGSAARTGDQSPFSVLREERGRYLIHGASTAAAARGVSPGMTMTAALALCPALETENRDITLEQSRLRELAERAGRFTSLISPEPPDSLLLEVRGSLRLFGSLAHLRNRIRDEFSLLGHRSCIAATPSPAASLLLARSGCDGLVSRREALRSSLGPLPVTALALPRQTLARLRHAGVRTLCDLWRLPRKGLALRFGPELTQYMNRLTGIAVEPRAGSSAPGEMISSLELPAGITQTGRLQPHMEGLLEALNHWLRSRDAGIRSVRFFLHHPRCPATTVAVGTRFATRDASRLSCLLEEQLKPVHLPEPVTGVTLVSGTPRAWAPEPCDLFAGRRNECDPKRQEREWARLLDQLAAKLGEAALRRPAAPGDHRPEGKDATINARTMESRTERPVWILPRPRPLASRHGKPWLDGPLSLADKAERIETGWWDGKSIRRDYHVATTLKGGRIWIYRDTDTGDKWHLQGYFS